jgi:hypothetical protein
MDRLERSRSARAFAAAARYRAERVAEWTVVHAQAAQRAHDAARDAAGRLDGFRGTLTQRSSRRSPCGVDGAGGRPPLEHVLTALHDLVVEPS